ncbi:PorV/PorQ family protein [bacterium]|nr:PorV/PorQ family protein [bacterium]
MRKIIFIGCFVFYSVLQPIFCAAEKEGTVAGIILKQEIGARQMGMGGAQVAVAGDMNTLYYNPAGLADIAQAEISTMYLDGLADVIYGSVGYVHPLKIIPDLKDKNKERKSKYGTVGIGIITLQGGEIEINYLDGTSEKKIVQADYVLSLGYGREIKKVLLGINLKTIYTTLIEEYNAYAFALDVGGIYRLPYKKLKGLRFGVVLQNLGTEIKYKEEGDPLPLTVKIGTAYEKRFNRIHYVQGAVDVVRSIDSQIRENIGVEYIFKDMLAGRVGTRMGYDLGLMTYGIGLYINKVKLDYAWVYGEGWDSQHRISLSFQFSGRSMKKKREVKKEKRKTKKIIGDVRLGMDLFMRKKWVKALEVWEGILEKNPKHKLAQDYVSKTKERLNKLVEDYCDEAKQHYGKKQWLKASQLWKRAWKISGKKEKRAKEGIEKIKIELKVILDSGERFYVKGKYGESLREWQGINDRYPNYLGVTAKIENTQIKIREMIDIKKRKIIKTIVAEGRKHYEKGRYSKTMDKFRQVLKLSPQNKEAVSYINKIAQDYFKKGIIFYKQNEFNKAISCWDKVLEIKPGNKKIKMWRKKAEKDFNEKVYVFYEKGIDKYNEGNYVDALTLWKKGLEYAPGHKKMKQFFIEANLAQGILYYRENKLGGAIVYWKEVLKIESKHPKALKYLRRAKTKQKRLRALNKE